mgnify:CR=1 FL=1
MIKKRAPAEHIVRVVRLHAKGDMSKIRSALLSVVKHARADVLDALLVAYRHSELMTIVDPYHIQLWVNTLTDPKHMRIVQCITLENEQAETWMCAAVCAGNLPLMHCLLKKFSRFAGTLLARVERKTLHAIRHYDPLWNSGYCHLIAMLCSAPDVSALHEWIKCARDTADFPADFKDTLYRLSVFFTKLGDKEQVQMLDTLLQ